MGHPPHCLISSPLDLKNIYINHESCPKKGISTGSNGFPASTHSFTSSDTGDSLTGYRQMSQQLYIIVATSPSGGIGIRGGIPWHRDEDLIFFERITMGSVCIMGSRTWRSIGCRELPGRHTIVVSRHPIHAERVTQATTFGDAMLMAAGHGPTVFAIGGEHIFRAARCHPLFKGVYITPIDTDCTEFDRWFPLELLNGLKWTATLGPLFKLKFSNPIYYALPE